MAWCRDDASVSLLSNMRVMSLLCQGDDTMLQVQRICNNVPGAEYLVQCTWYNVSGKIYLAQYIGHNVTCNWCPICASCHSLYQGEGACNHRKDSAITRTICKNPTAKCIKDGNQHDPLDPLDVCVASKKKLRAKRCVGQGSLPFWNVMKLWTFSVQGGRGLNSFSGCFPD